jgi:hypothetical protein
VRLGREGVSDRGRRGGGRGGGGREGGGKRPRSERAEVTMVAVERKDLKDELSRLIMVTWNRSDLAERHRVSTDRSALEPRVHM